MIHNIKQNTLFVNDDRRIADNDMKVFFENIRDWGAAAKLSGKALTFTGIGTTLLNSLNNEI